MLSNQKFKKKIAYPKVSKSKDSAVLCESCCVTVSSSHLNDFLKPFYQIWLSLCPLLRSVAAKGTLIITAERVQLYKQPQLSLL